MDHIGIDHVKKLMTDLDSVAKDILALVKHGPGSILAIADLIKVARDMIANVPGAIPEMKDLEPQELADLGQLALQIVMDVIGSLAKVK